MREEATTLCHRCRWGAPPGHLTQCSCPRIPTDLTDLRADGMSRPYGEATKKNPDELNPVAWALPSIATANEHCTYFAPTDLNK